MNAGAERAYLYMFHIKVPGPNMVKVLMVVTTAWAIDKSCVMAPRHVTLQYINFKKHKQQSPRAFMAPWNTFSIYLQSKRHGDKVLTRGHISLASLVLLSILAHVPLLQDLMRHILFNDVFFFIAVQPKSIFWVWLLLNMSIIFFAPSSHLPVPLSQVISVKFPMFPCFYHLLK